MAAAWNASGAWLTLRPDVIHVLDERRAEPQAHLLGIGSQRQFGRQCHRALRWPRRATFSPSLSSSAGGGFGASLVVSAGLPPAIGGSIESGVGSLDAGQPSSEVEAKAARLGVHAPVPHERHSRLGAPSIQALTSARVVNRRQARAIELPAEHWPRAAVQAGGLPVERH
jgi:hypothetical protein